MPRPIGPVSAPLIASRRADARRSIKPGPPSGPCSPPLRKRPANRRRESLMIATSRWNSSHRRLQYAHIPRWCQRVGKTTIGAQLAGLLEYRFFDLDVEIERFFGTSIERLRNRHLTSHDFRLVASQALKDVLSRQDSYNCVIALPPSGLLGGYWKVVNETRDATIVVLRDAAENILGRITFYDIDSRRVPMS
jgi:hypothetical protein